MKNEEFGLLDDLSEHANSPKKTKYTPNSLAQKASSKHRVIKSSIHKNDKNRNINNKNNLKLDLTLENSKNKNNIHSSRKEKKDDKFTKYTPDYRNKTKISKTYKSENKRKSVNNGKNSPSKKNILRNSFQIGNNFILTSKKRFDITTSDIIPENTNIKPRQETKISTKQHNLQNTLNIKNNKGASVDSRKIKNNQKLKLSIRESTKKESELNLSHSIKKERKDDDNISKKSTKEKKLTFHEKKESELISKKSTINDKKESELISKKSTIRSKKESELISKKTTKKDSELISKKSTLKEKKEEKKTNKKNELKEIKEEKHYKKITSKEIKEDDRQYKANTSRDKKDEKKQKKNNLKEKKHEEKTLKGKEEKKEKNVDINNKKNDQKDKSLGKKSKEPNMNKKDKDKNIIAKKLEELKEIKIESKFKNLKSNEIKTKEQVNSSIKKFNSNSSLSLTKKDDENLEDLEKEKSKKKPIKKIVIKQKNISNSSRENNNDNQNLTDVNLENNNSSKNKKYISNMDISYHRNKTTNYVNKKLNLKNKKEKSQMNMKNIKNDKKSNAEKIEKEKKDNNTDKNESNILIKSALITSDKIILEKNDDDNNTFNKLSNSNSKNQINPKDKKINSAQNLNQILKEKLSNKNVNDKKDLKKSVRLSIVSEKILFDPINLENIQEKKEEINNEEEAKKSKLINDEKNKNIQMNQDKEKMDKKEENNDKEENKEDKKEEKKEDKKEDKKEEKEKKIENQQEKDIIKEKDQKSEKSSDISSDSNENSLSGKEKDDSVLKKQDVQNILKELEKETKESKESAIKQEVPQNNSADTVKQKKVIIKRKTIVIQKSCSSEIRDNSNKNSLNNKSIYNSINKGIRSKSEKAISEFSINEEKIVVDSFKSQASLSRAGKDEAGNIKTNQDSYIVLTRVNNLKEYNIFGVLDGHGTEGHLVSQFVSQYMQREFQTHPSLEKLKDIEKIYSTLSSNDFELIKNIFINADLTLKDKKIDSRTSGTTCVLVIQVGEHIICANTGDSRAVLVFDEKNDDKLNFIKVFPLSIDSKPEIPAEKERIIQAGGSVEKIINKYGQPAGPFRVWAKNKDYPGLAMSRSIGDFNGKSVGLIPDPEIIECNLSIYSKYIIICSDGVWEFLSNDDAMNIGKKYYLENNPRGFCKELIDSSVKFWEKEDVVIDDITVVTIFF